MSESLGYEMLRMSPEATPLYLVIQFFFLAFEHVIIIIVPQTNWVCVPESIPLTCQSRMGHLVMLRMSPEATLLYLVIQFFFWTFEHVIIMNVTQTNWVCAPQSIPLTCQSRMGHLVMLRMSPEATPLYLVIQIFSLLLGM